MASLFMYLLPVLGLHCCTGCSLAIASWGYSLVAVQGLLTAVAFLVAEHGPRAPGLSSCGTWAYLLHGTWNLPRPGIKPVSPPLTGRFLAIAPPGKFPDLNNF